MGAHRVTQLAGVPRAAQRSVDLAGVGKAVMGAHRVTQLAGVPQAAQKSVDSGQLVSANHRPAIWRRLVLWFWVAPTVVAVWYSAAIFFPDTARHYASAFLWTDGAIATNATSHITEFQCPKPTLCATVGVELALLVVSRLTAFAMYVTLALVFLSKCHALHFVLERRVGYTIPFEGLHDFHARTGGAFAALGLAHTAAHLVRWGLRGELGFCGGLAAQTGIIAMAAMLLVVSAFACACVRRRLSFETRRALHWCFVVVLVALVFHAPRCNWLVPCLAGVWVLDWVYQLVRCTYKIEGEDVHFLRLPDGGVQLRWRNPPGFNPVPGNYVKIHLPWLESADGRPVGEAEPWHCFSVYMADATAEGSSDLRADEESVDSLPDLHDDEKLRLTEALHAKEDDVALSLVDGGGPEFATTHVLVMPVGGWTKALDHAVQDGHGIHRALWVRGPYVSPYASASAFAHLILIASGIGITPALGVLGQFSQGRSGVRPSFVLWSTRSLALVKFFAPLLKDAQCALIFYTGKEELTAAALLRIKKRTGGRCFVLPQRADFVAEAARIVTSFEEAAAMSEVPAPKRAQWCALYCGGSKRIRATVAKAARSWGIGFEMESFDW